MPERVPSARLLISTGPRPPPAVEPAVAEGETTDSAKGGDDPFLSFGTRDAQGAI
jgi:hypothetical protein